VEDLWARRKVGYLLDQIRANGEKKELVEEVVTLAKRYGITTPYTSYLVVPDAAVPVARAPRPDGKPDVRFHVAPVPAAPPAALNMPARPGEAPAPAKTVTSFVKEAQEKAKAIPGYGFGGGVSGPGTVPTGGLPGGAFSGGSGYGMMGGGGGF